MVHVTEKANTLAAITGPRGAAYNVSSKAPPTKQSPEQIANEKAEQDQSNLEGMNVKPCKQCWVKYLGGIAIVFLVILLVTGKIKF